MLTPQQIVLRKTGIGGSDAAAILGLSRYASPLDIYISKTTDVINKTSSDDMDRGNALEPFVATLFSYKTGISFTPSLETIRCKEHEFMIANLDGLIPSEQSILEVKTAHYSKKSEWGEEYTDEIPQEYLIQVAHYASVMNANKVYVPVLFGDVESFKEYGKAYKLIVDGHKADLEEIIHNLRIYVYNADKDFQNKIIKKERSFWFDHVQKLIMPPLEDCTKSKEILKAYPLATNEQIKVGQKEIEEIERLKQIKLMQKELEQQEDQLKSNILKILGEASVIVDESGNTLATWKNKFSKRFSTKKFESKYPELYHQFTDENCTREFRIV